MKVYTKLKRHLIEKLVKLIFLTTSILVLISDLLYPTLWIEYTLFIVFVAGIFSTPILLFWKWYNISNEKKNEFLKILISIWVGLFITFIFIQRPSVMIGEKIWNKKTIKLERLIEEHSNKYGEYPIDMETLLDSTSIDQNFINKNYISRIQIILGDSTKDFFPYDTMGYMLGRGIWPGDMQTWNPETKDWKFDF